MTRPFAIGFSLGLLFFLIINLTSAHLASDCGLPAVIGIDSCADDVVRAGWPLTFYEEGGLDYHKEFQKALLAFDLLLGVLVAITIGWLANRRFK